MSGAQIAGVVIGFLVVVVTIWNIVRNGIAGSTGNIDGVNIIDHSHGGDHIPPA